MNVRNAWIDKFLLSPLETLYGALPVAKKAIYHDALKYMNDDQLKAGFAYIRDNYAFQRFPSIADIKQGIQKSSEGKTIAHGSSRKEFPWEKIERMRKEMIEKWRAEFLKSTLYKQACIEKWDSRFYRYANAIAWIQAQIVHPYKDGRIGYDYEVLRYDEKIEDILRRERLNASSHGINIEIDQRLIEKWKWWAALENPKEALAA